MAKVTVLLEGFLSKDSGGHTRPNIILVQDKNLNIVIDPGVVASQKLIIDALKKENLNLDDIDMVFLTHAHLDHSRNVGMFAKAKSIWFGDLWDGDVEKSCPEKLSADIRFIETPGHSYDSTTMLVKTNEGLVAICGDVFWQKNYPKNDPYATDNKNLAASRAKVLKLADIIIPGHGKAFRPNL